MIWKLKVTFIYSEKIKLIQLSLNFCSNSSSPGFEFTEDGPDLETVFRSAFGGNRSYYWSFINEENPQWRSSTNYSSNYGRSWNWRHRVHEDYDSSNEYEDSEANLASHRLALGLQASGPLKLEDVKNAWAFILITLTLHHTSVVYSILSLIENQMLKGFLLNLFFFFSYFFSVLCKFFLSF